MAKSTLTLQEDGKLIPVLGDQLELTHEERAELSYLESVSAQLQTAQIALRKESEKIETALQNNPEYAKLIRYRDKIKTAKKFQKQTAIVIEHEMDKIFKSRGIKTPMAEHYANLLPEKPTAEHRGPGRPRLASKN